MLTIYNLKLELALDAMPGIKWYRYADTCYLVASAGNLDILAQALCNVIYEGSFIYGASSIAWVRGSASVIYITRQANVAEIEATRWTCQNFTGKEAPYSVNACSRAMMKAIGIKDEGCGDTTRMLALTGWHALKAVPGKYKAKKLVDLKGAYWQLVARAPSPIVNVIDGRVSFGVLPRDQARRWSEFRAALAKHKRARCGLVGSLAAAKACIFRRGGYEERQLPRGQFHHFAHTIVATCYEITSEASLSTGSVYDHTDCITIDYNVNPAIFDDLNLVYETKDSGDTEVIAVGNRKVGNDKTEYYKAHEDGIIFDATPHASQYHGLSVAKWLGV